MARTSTQDSMATVKKSLQPLQISLSEMESHVTGYDLQLAQIRAQIDAIWERDEDLRRQEDVADVAANVGKPAESRAAGGKAARLREREVHRPSAGQELGWSSTASEGRRGVSDGPEDSHGRPGGALRPAPYARLTVTSKSWRPR